MKKYFFLLLSLVLFTSLVKSQITIVNVQINSLNITPSSMCSINIMNSGQKINILLEAQILNSTNDLLITVKTNPIALRQGMNTINGSGITFQSVMYSKNPQGDYIQSHRSLPSGNYHYCCKINAVGPSEPESDDYCEDIISEMSTFMLLITPYDKDTVEETRPMFIWNHSEPFNVLSAGEYFKLMLAQLSEGQSAEGGVTNNLPLYEKSFLTSHNIQYPLDAPELKKGGRYGWQIQKVSNGIITDKTEGWEFIVQPEKIIKENKYAVLKKELDGGFYSAVGNKLFFRFEEDYSSSSGSLNCTIFDWKKKIIQPKVKQDANKDDGASSKSTISVKSNGFNRFEINLDDLDISKGYFTLEVKNEKKELYVLKFYVQ